MEIIKEWYGKYQDYVHKKRLKRINKSIWYFQDKSRNKPLYPRMFKSKDGTTYFDISNEYVDALKDLEISKSEVERYFKDKYPEDYI